jgi:hypothetical protein
MVARRLASSGMAAMVALSRAMVLTQKQRFAALIMSHSIRAGTERLTKSSTVAHSVRKMSPEVEAFGGRPTVV